MHFDAAVESVLLVVKTHHAVLGHGPTMKRKWALLAVLVVIAVASLCAHWIMRSQPGITWTNYERIELGMSLEEVETILGRSYVYQPIGDPTRDGGPGFWWQGDDLSIIIAVDNDHRVTGTYYEKLSSPSFLSKLRRWLGR
jgi:hypothetical protein